MAVRAATFGTPVLDEPAPAVSAPPELIAYVCTRLAAGGDLFATLGDEFVHDRAQGDPTVLDALARDPQVREHVARLPGSRLAVKPGSVRVVIAEDHHLYRRTVVRAVERAGAQPVGEAADGAEAVRLIERLRPDLAVVDMRMPELDGLGVCQAIAARRADLDTRILLLSAYDDPELVWSTVSAGAAGYVDKAAPQDEICAAIKRVAAGGIAFTDRTRQGVNRGFSELYA